MANDGDDDSKRDDKTEKAERDLARLYRDRVHDRGEMTGWRRRQLAKAPQAVSDVLRVIFQKNPAARAKLLEQEAFAAWNKYIGESAAHHSEPIEIRKRVLYVRVPNPIWRNELSFIKNGILERYQREFPHLGLQDIFFKAW